MNPKPKQPIFVEEKDYKDLTYFSYAHYFEDGPQLFTTTTKVIDDARVGDNYYCENISEEEYEEPTILPEYKIKIIKGHNYGHILTLTDEVYHKNILNPNLRYGDELELEIVSVEGDVVKYQLNDLDYLRFD